MFFGWAGQILNVDLSNRASSTEAIDPFIRSFIGGRGFSVKKLYGEVDSHLSPFEPENRLYFSPGVLTGTPMAASSRLKVTGMAVGGLLRHAGLGGKVANEIKCAGYDLIVIHGKSDKPIYLYINDSSIEFKDASHLWGKDIYETQKLIKDELGESVEVMCIGLGGENQVVFGSIHTSWSNAAGRCGFGGIMGSKNLKAIAVRGTNGIRIAKPEEFLKVAEEQRKSFAQEEWIELARNEGGGRTLARDWQENGMGAYGNWEDAPELDTLHFKTFDEFNSRYGVGLHVCGSCPISHLVVYDVPGIGKGGAKCTPHWSFTASVWNDDRKLVFRAYNLANKYGLDAISTCNIIAFLMELYDKGIITTKDTDGIPMKRGDGNAIISAIHKIGKQEGFGKLFKDGVVQGAKRIGRGAEEYVMATKGLELEPYEFRVYKQMALANAVNSKDQIDGNSPLTLNGNEEEALKLFGTREVAFPLSYEGAVIGTWDGENRTTVGDMIGMCKQLLPWFVTVYFDTPAKLFSLATGIEMSEADLLFAAQRVLTLERAFNVIKGIRRENDTMPERLFKEAVPSGPYKGERLSKKKFNEMIDSYYALRGWDKDGVPKEETFRQYGLLSEWKVFKQKVPIREREITEEGESIG